MDVKFVGDIPKGLRAYAIRQRHKVSEVNAGYGWCTDSGFAYEAVYRPGWSMSDDAVHSEIAQTAGALIAKIKSASPCDCEECAEVIHRTAQD
jgi:hypothetical protein